MSRYSRSYVVKSPLEKFFSQFEGILKECSIEIVHFSQEYIMAREVPGKVPFNRLVVVEVLVDRGKTARGQMRIDLIVKNEELPLQINNHCYNLYESILEKLSQAPEWSLL